MTRDMPDLGPCPSIWRSQLRPASVSPRLLNSVWARVHESSKRIRELRYQLLTQLIKFAFKQSINDQMVVLNRDIPIFQIRIDRQRNGSVSQQFGELLLWQHCCHRGGHFDFHRDALREFNVLQAVLR